MKRSLKREISWMLGILTLTAMLFSGVWKHPSPSGELRACMSNLRNLGTALEMYSDDHGGTYPHDFADNYPRANLKLLTPGYLVSLPTCPAAGYNTYTPAFQAPWTDPERYCVVCEGDWHVRAGCKPNFPEYTSDEGLVVDADRPWDPYPGHAYDRSVVHGRGSDGSIQCLPHPNREKCEHGP